MHRTKWGRVAQVVNGLLQKQQNQTKTKPSQYRFVKWRVLKCWNCRTVLIQVVNSKTKQNKDELPQKTNETKKEINKISVYFWSMHLTSRWLTLPKLPHFPDPLGYGKSTMGCFSKQCKAAILANKTFYSFIWSNSPLPSAHECINLHGQTTVSSLQIHIQFYKQEQAIKQKQGGGKTKNLSENKSCNFTKWLHCKLFTHFHKLCGRG